VTTTLATYGHLFDGVDARLDELLERAHDDGLAGTDWARSGHAVVDLEEHRAGTGR